MVHLHEGFGETVLLEEVGYLVGGFAQGGLKPGHGKAGGFGLLKRGIHLPALYQTEGIPDFVAEIAALFAECLVEEDVVARRG